jgi:hypothetical protein
MALAQVQNYHQVEPKLDWSYFSTRKTHAPMLDKASPPSAAAWHQGVRSRAGEGGGTLAALTHYFGKRVMERLNIAATKRKQK